MEAAIKLTIRLPVALHERLVELAQSDRRSLNNEIVVLLEHASAMSESHQSTRRPHGWNATDPDRPLADLPAPPSRGSR